MIYVISEETCSIQNPVKGFDPLYHCLFTIMSLIPAVGDRGVGLARPSIKVLLVYGVFPLHLQLYITVATRTSNYGGGRHRPLF